MTPLPLRYSSLQTKLLSQMEEETAGWTAMASRLELGTLILSLFKQLPNSNNKFLIIRLVFLLKL